MIGDITVKQLYEYALQHNYLNADAKTVLDIINREKVCHKAGDKEIKNILVSPISKSSTVDFSSLVEYSTEDLIALFST